MPNKKSKQDLSATSSWRARQVIKYSGEALEVNGRLIGHNLALRKWDEIKLLVKESKKELRDLEAVFKNSAIGR